VADVQKMKALAKLDTMKSLVDEKRAWEAFREMQFRRMEDLASKKVVDANLVEESRVQRDAAKAQRITAEGNVAEAESQVALEQARVEVAQLKLEEAELRMKQLKARIQPQR
jgi:multidrug resistance efflux pump